MPTGWQRVLKNFGKKLDLIGAIFSRPSEAVRPAVASLLYTLVMIGPSPVGAEDFDTWLAAFRDEALQAGIRGETLDAALTGVKPIPRVIELDRHQPESTQTFAQYMAKRVTGGLAEEGRRALRDNRVLLEEIGGKFGVQPRFIVALWGLETRFGAYTGGFPVVGALATLAHDGRRGAYFRGELLNALKIIDEGHIPAAEMRGSWAGAMGQSQFMPATFVSYAVDYDGDGRRDIWTTLDDVFASAANYLANLGWRDDQTWGREVRLPADFDLGLTGHGVIKPLSDWQALGVRRADGTDLPTRQLSASVILPGGAGGPSYVVYDNYRRIRNWNRSDYFAMSVGRLSDLIGGG